MEGERDVPNYELQVSFTNTPQAIHEMGFVQFEENQVLSFVSPSTQSQLSQSLNSGGSTTNVPTGAAATTTTAAVGFSHNDLVTRTPWNNEQVFYLFILLLFNS
jgi:hypothetical protein